METSSTATRAPLYTIRPSTGWSAVNLKELLQYRDLLFVFASRDVKLRYRQTLLGPVWILLQPLMGAGVLSFVFGGIAKLKAPGHMPIFVYSFTGMLGWNVFSGLISKVSVSLVGNTHLISKVYFPRLLLPFSTIFGVLIDFTAALLIVPFLLVAFHITPGLPLLMLPVWVFLLALMGMGIGLCASAVMVLYRDVSPMVSVVMGFLPYISAVGFDLTQVRPEFKHIVVYNPIIGLLEGMRWSLVNLPFSGSANLAYSVVASVAIFFLGIMAFKRMERIFADVI